MYRGGFRGFVHMWEINSEPDWQFAKALPFINTSTKHIYGSEHTISGYSMG